MKISCRSLILPAVLAFLAGVTPAFAQQSTTTTTITTSDDDHGGIGIGVEGGITRNTLTGTPTNPQDFFDTRTGTLVGVWIGGNKPGPVGFVGEFLYLFRRTGVNTGAASDVLTQHALEIPTLFRINFGQGGSNGIAGYAVVGPVFTINLQTSLRSGLNTDNFSSGDIGIMAGGGFEAYRIGFEVRGNWGQKRVTNSANPDFQDLKNRSVEFVLKFRFN
jgi:hypothetical protein